MALQGHALHYLDEGSGPPLLLLHGNPTWSFLYRHLIWRLRGRFRCVAPDYPGFGRSRAAAGFGFSPPEYARLVAQLVRALDLRGLTLLGHDWGGPIGLAAAQGVPERVAGLALANTFAWPLNRDPRLVAFSLAAGGPLGGAAIRYGNALVNLGLPLALQRHCSRSLLAGRPFLAAVWRHLDCLTGKPSLLLWGERDPAFGRAYRQRLARALPRATVVPLPGAGHFSPEDAPAAIAAALADWHAGGTSGR